MKIMTRREAIAGGLKRYFTGEPCRRGHVAERHVSGNGCVECKAEKRREYYLENREVIKKKSSEWKKKNPFRVTYQSHKDGAKFRSIDWEFTYETWLLWWGMDFYKIGQEKDDLCCARYNDEGPYSPENCYKATKSENTRHYCERRWKKDHPAS